jgi:hypothetical protein
MSSRRYPYRPAKNHRLSIYQNPEINISDFIITQTTRDFHGFLFFSKADSIFAVCPVQLMNLNKSRAAGFDFLL